MLWKNATLSKPLSFGPDGYGWTIKDNKLQLVWFEGPQTPDSVSLNDDSDTDNDDLQLYAASSVDESIDED